MTKQPKPKKCKAKNCGQLFAPARPMQCACSIACACDMARAKREQAERKVVREKLKALDGLPVLKRRAQAAFNGFIRARDAGKPCICCGAWPHPGGTDAGHYRSVGSAPHLRFVESNVHAQAKQCNKWGAGRAVDYRIGLIGRIGLAAVEEIEADNTPRHYSREQLIDLAKNYKEKTRELLKSRA